MRRRFGEMTMLADGPTYLHICACANVNLNIQSEYKMNISSLLQNAWNASV